MDPDRIARIQAEMRLLRELAAMASEEIESAVEFEHQLSDAELAKFISSLLP